MNDEKLTQLLKETQTQADEAATQFGKLLRKGAEKLRDAADKAAEAIRQDIDRHPD